MARKNLWPTPTVQDAENDGGPSQFDRNSLPLNAAVKLWPTPTAGDSRSSGSRNLEGSKAHAGMSLTDAVQTGNSTTPRRERFPTPTREDAKNHGSPKRGAEASRHSLTLEGVAKLFPTPTVRDANTYAKVKRGARSEETTGGGTPLVMAVSPEGPPAGGGQLNPTWVEWLMGFPLGWTVSARWETRSSRKSRRSSGGD